jgi:ribose transport system ATP-binding protein
MSAEALRVERLSKRFGGVQALDEVTFEIAAGEVHGLLGENGSGKSTLIKILAGFHEPEPGARLKIHGRDVPLPLEPGRFRELGISFVHQDLGLIPSLTVVENLRIGELASTWSWHLSWREQRRRARELFASYGLDLDPAAPVAELSQVERASLAIVRAAESIHQAEKSHDTRITPLLVLDEPTVFLPRTGVDQLFGLIRTLVERGASVLFVSHDIAEVREITDRVTVLRDGRVQGTIATREASEQVLIEMIVGRALVLSENARAATDASPRLELELVSRSGATLEIGLAAGEILGLTGLVGSGFEHVPYAIYGAEPAAGRLRIDHTTVELASITPDQALALGFVLLPANRQRDASVGDLSLAENIMLPVLARYRGRFWFRRGALNADAEALLKRLDVRPANPRLPFEALSGGNQQKAVLAKWLQLEPRVLLLHEPTQGVDIGAREQVYAIIRDVAAGGASVICASSDYDQLARLCSRVLVFARGHVVSELTGDRVNKDTITEQCFNSLSLARSAA